MGKRTEYESPPACAEARERIEAALGGELPPGDRIVLDAHLGSCAGCRALSDAAAALTGELRAAFPEKPAPPGLKWRMLESARARGSAKLWLRLGWRLVVSAATAATAVAIVLRVAELEPREPALTVRITLPEGVRLTSEPRLTVIRAEKTR